MRKRKNRVRIFVLCALSLFLISFLSLSLAKVAAYLTAGKNADNTLHAGTAVIEIKEHFDPEPQEGIYKKEVKVVNTGTVPVYLRVFPAFSDMETANAAELSSDGKTFLSYAEYLDNLPEPWNRGADGYLYYETLLCPGEETTQLMSAVRGIGTVDPEADNPFLIITAEAIQGKGSDADNCREAFAAWDRKEAAK